MLNLGVLKCRTLGYYVLLCILYLYVDVENIFKCTQDGVRLTFIVPLLVEYTRTVHKFVRNFTAERRADGRPSTPRPGIPQDAMTSSLSGDLTAATLASRSQACKQRKQHILGHQTLW